MPNGQKDVASSIMDGASKTIVENVASQYKSKDFSNIFEKDRLYVQRQLEVLQWTETRR